MRWLPDRTRSQHWALRIFQIAQGTALITLPLVEAIRNPINVTYDGWWFCVGLGVVTWTTFLGRRGWTVTLMIAGIVVGALIPAPKFQSAEQMLIHEIVSGALGLAIGVFLDAIGLRTRTIIDPPNLSPLTDSSPKTFVETKDSTTQSIRGDEK